jgi:hypothetical protein
MYRVCILQWRTAAEELGDEDEVAEASGAGPESLVDVVRSWGQLKANDSGWPTFDGWYASYPLFKREWKAYRETYHSVVNDNLAAKALRDKCIKRDALRMVSHLEDCKKCGRHLTPALRGQRSTWRKFFSP